MITVRPAPSLPIGANVMENSQGAGVIRLNITQEMITNFCQEVTELIERMPNLRTPEEESAASITCNGHTGEVMPWVCGPGVFY